MGRCPKNKAVNANKRNISEKSTTAFYPKRKKGSPKGALEITEAARNFKRA